MTLSFEHELCNGECTALPGRRASVKGGLGARRIGQHHGKRHCHVSLECLRGTVPLIDVVVLQGHLYPIGSSRRQLTGIAPEREVLTSSERRMRLDSGNRLAFAERTDYIDTCLCQNRLSNEVHDGRRRLGRADGCLGSGSWPVWPV